MAKRGGTLRTALYFAAIGLVVGLLVIFVGLTNVLTATKAEPREQTYPQRAEAAFLATARDDWIYTMKKDPNQVLGRIAVQQAQTGDLDTTLARVDDVQLNKDIVRNVAVYTFLNQKISSTKEPTLADIEPALKIANQIQNPLLKADALRRVGEVQLRADVAVAKKTLKDAAAAVPQGMQMPIEPPPPLFNPMSLIWPAGLAIFGLVLGLLVTQLVGSRRKAKVEEVEDEEEDEEEEEKAKAALPPMAEEPAPMAEMPIESPPVVDVPVGAEIPMEPMGADLAGDMPLVAPPPAPSPSALSRPQPAGAPVGAGSEAKKTMMARQGAAKPTMLAAKGPAAATQLAKATAAPTKMADNADPMPLPEQRKTQQK